MAEFVIATLQIGQLDYGTLAAEILAHYCRQHGYEWHAVTECLHNTKEAHPAWCKLLTGRLFPDAAFVLWWDLDLLPTGRNEPIRPQLDLTALNLAEDWSLNDPGAQHYNANFRYNTGLFGIPRRLFSAMDDLYNQWAPGKRPSYEQYYVNDWIAENAVPVHVLDQRFNTFTSAAYATEPFNVHYTGLTYLPQWRPIHVREHHRRYFATDAPV